MSGLLQRWEDLASRRRARHVSRADRARLSIASYPTTAVASAAKGRTIAGSGYLGAIVPESAEAAAAAEGRIGTGRSQKTSAPATRGDGSARIGPVRRRCRATPRRDLQLAPESVQAHNNLGVALASLGRMDEAIEQFEQALTLDPLRRCPP